MEYGGTPAATRLRQQVIPGLCEKGLSSSRAGTKQKTIEALLWLIELDSPDPVVELMVPYLSARLPKLVAGTVKALYEIYSQFGAQVVSPKLILPSLPKLFSHADRTVRAETSNLTVELFLWMGDSLEQILFSDLKPVQQKDLTVAFEKVKDQKPTQKRLLKSQQIANEQNAAAAGIADEDNDVVMGSTDEPATIDPYDLVEPVDVLSKLPSDLTTRVTSAKWKDRVEVLTEVEKEMNVMKYLDVDYIELVRILAKCIKDVNIQVVSLAAKCIEFMAKGLRTRFQKYIQTVLTPLLERCKEKKPSVLDALNGALDAIFQCSSLSEVLPDTLDAMKSKTPQVRSATCQYLIRILKETKIPPTKSEVAEIITSAVKLVGDTLPDVRTRGFEAVGTLMKICGERELNSHLDSIDDLKMKKIKEFYENAEVKSKMNSSTKPTKASASSVVSATGSKGSVPKASSTKRKSTIGKPSSGIPSSSSLSSSSLGATSSIAKKRTMSSIPSKRGPTSPLKSDPSNSRMGSVGKSGLTGRSLQSTASSSLHLNGSNNSHGLTDAERVELEQLRQEKLKWQQEREKQKWSLEESMNDSSKLMKEIQQLSSKIDKLNEQHTSDLMTIKSRETQLQRAQSDLEISNLKISQLENEIELIQKQKSASSFTVPSFTLDTSSISNSFHGSLNNGHQKPLQDSNVSPYVNESTNSALGGLTTGTKTIEGLDRRVSGLSIDSNDQKENGALYTRATLDTSDESWRRAAEVTSQLKARIEKMKAKSRASSQRNL